MAKSNVKCPICGQMNFGVDLEETEGWVECSNCKSDFMPSEHLQKITTNVVPIPEVTFRFRRNGASEKRA